MSFELLDSILQDSGKDPAYVQENKKVEEPESTPVTENGDANTDNGNDVVVEGFEPSETLLEVLEEGLKERYRKGQIDALNGAMEYCNGELAKCKDDKCKEKWNKEIKQAKAAIEKNKAKMKKEDVEPEKTEDNDVVSEGTENAEVVVEETINEDMFYADLDQLIEDAMRTSLRNTITESTIPSDTKLEHLGIVENAVFNKDQMVSFVEGNIDPILKCSGVFSGSYDLGGDNPVAISLPVYEAALILHVANEGLLESINVKEDEKPIKNSLYESLMESQQTEKDYSKSLEIVNEHLAVLYDKYEISEDTDREALFNEAVHVINKYDISNIRPSFHELAECVCEYNKKAESDGEELFANMLPEDLELSESENIYVRSLDRMNKIPSSLIPESIKNKFKNVSEGSDFTGNGSVISIANVVTGLSSMVLFRESKVENLEVAIDKAVKNIESQKNTCKNTSNVKMCEACNKKLSDKWATQIRKEETEEVEVEKTEE